MRALRLGALGCVRDEATREELLNCIGCALRGDPVSTDGNAGTDTVERLLSGREEALLRGLASGKQLWQVAEEMSVSPKTAGSYQRRVLNKLRLNSPSDLVRYAIALGLAKYR